MRNCERRNRFDFFKKKIFIYIYIYMNGCYTSWTLFHTHAHATPLFSVESPLFERFHTQLSFHPSSSSSHSLPVFPLMSPAPSPPVCCRTLPPHLPRLPPPPILHQCRSSLSRLFACELIPTPGYSPADERWGYRGCAVYATHNPCSILQSGGEK